MVPSRPGFRRYVPLVFFLLALVLLLAGFARPQANVSQPREGATVVLALDISGSMDAKDVNSLDGPGRTTRLLAAREAASAFLKELPERYRVSLVLFGNRGIVKVAPTYDHQKILAALPTQSQDRGHGARERDRLDRHRRPACLRETGGGPAAEPGRGAAHLGRRQYGARRPGGLCGEGAQARPADLDGPARDNGPARGHRPEDPGGTNHVQVPVQADQLQKIARGTNGTFFQVHTAGELKQVYEDLGSRLVKDKKKREITVAAAGAGIAFMVAGALLSGIWFRRIV